RHEVLPARIRRAKDVRAGRPRKLAGAIRPDRRTCVPGPRARPPALSSAPMSTPPWSPDLFLRAARFAARAHHGQKLPGSELPYFLHIAQVAAEVMAALAVEPAERPDLALACALLHDTVEDTEVDRAAVAAEFGEDVAA